MRPQRVAGLVALVSGSLLLLGAVVAACAPGAFAPSGVASWSSGMGPGHMAMTPQRRPSSFTSPKRPFSTWTKVWARQFP